MAKGKPVSDEKKKDRQKGFIGAGLSATIGPIFKKWGESMAMALPEDHWIRHSEIFKRGFPALTTLLENMSDELPMWAGAIVEQIIDGTDAFQGALDLSTRQGKAQEATVDNKWINQFTAGVFKRLQDATDKDAEFLKIEEE